MKKSILKFAGLAALLALAQNLVASEDEPRRPFAEWADLPQPGQLIFGTLYEQSEAYHVWEMGNERMTANYRTSTTKITALTCARAISRLITASPKNGRQT